MDRTEAEIPARLTDGAGIPASTGGRSRAEQVTRVACHAVAEVPFLVVALVQVVQGWRPTLDDAAISIRSWAVFTSRSPLLGEYTQATRCARHVVWNPGPLLYWMLAIPVRVDTGHGVLWGAAICAAAGMALCVEAAWAVRGAAGALAVGAFAVVLAATQPEVFVNPVWDPHFGLVWFAATCTGAWAVGTGHLRWWPVLVLTASIAAQSHLAFALPAALLAILAPLPGISRRLRSGVGGWTWLPVGLTAGGACWAAPIVQQLTGHPGNVSLLLRCVGGQRAMGGRFGLATLASAVVPPPLWFHRWSGSAPALLHGLAGQPAGVGIAVLATLATLAVVAWIAQRRDLAVLAGVGLLAAGSAAWEIAGQPKSTIVSLVEVVDVVLWPVGMLIWGVAALLVVEVVATFRAMPRRRGLFGRASSPSWPKHGRRLLAQGWPRTALLLSATAALFVGGTVNAAILAGGAMNQAAREAGGRPTFRGVSAAAAAAEQLVPSGPLMISVFGHTPDASLGLLYGTLWVLISQGRQATAPGFYADTISPPAHTVSGEPQVNVTVRADGSVASAVLAPGSPSPPASSRSIDRARRAPHGLRSPD
jgi:hypothetical protein